MQYPIYIFVQNFNGGSMEMMNTISITKEFIIVGMQGNISIAIFQIKCWTYLFGNYMCIILKNESRSYALRTCMSVATILGWTKMLMAMFIATWLW